MVYKSKSTQETMKLGESLAPFLRPGDVILLDGGLGAGKTHFVKGLAKGLGVTADVTSPTFTILNNYPLDSTGRTITHLNHYDVYRVHDEEEILDLGFEETIYGSDISVIEWSSLIPGILPEEALKVTLASGETMDERIIIMTWSNGSQERSLPNADTGL